MIVRDVSSSFSPGRNIFANLEDIVRYVKRRVMIGCERSGLPTRMPSVSLYRMHRIKAAILSKK